MRRPSIAALALLVAIAGSTTCAQNEEPRQPAPSVRRALGSTLRFAVIGDFGVVNGATAAVANLVRGWAPDLVITTGDNNYPNGAASTIDANIGQHYRQFISPYTGRFGPGAANNAFFPSLGNHDWVAPGAQPYLAYFTLPGNERYYDFVRGDVHFFALDSDPHEPDGVTSTGVQATWLRGRLAASTARWKVVYFHHAPFSSGAHGSTGYMQWPFREWGAHLVISGHDHLYERFNKNGITYVVNGLGGNAERYAFGGVVSGSVARYNAAHGAMLVEADAASLRLRFFNTGGALIDSVTLPPMDVVPRAQASNDAVSNRYTLSASQGFVWRRVYIDTDVSTATGFLASGVGADYLIENQWIYRHAGGGWSWTFLGSAGLANVGDGVGWTVSRATIGQTAFPNTDALVFEVENQGSVFQNLGRMEHVYSASDGMVVAYSAENDDTTIRYRATFASPLQYKHVFIDSDTNSATGYAYGGIGSDYLVENATVYRHAGAGWTWTRVGVVSAVGGSTGLMLWTVPRAMIGETAPNGELADILFHGFGGAPEYTTPVYRHVYSPTALTASAP